MKKGNFLFFHQKLHLLSFAYTDEFSTVLCCDDEVIEPILYII